MSTPPEDRPPEPPPPWSSPPGGYGVGLPPGVAYGGDDLSANRTQDQLGIVSLATGVLSLLTCLCCGPLSIALGVIAVIFGVVSLMRINAEPHRYAGKALAIAGITTGILGALVWVLLFVFLGAMSMFSSGHFKF